MSYQLPRPKDKEMIKQTETKLFPPYSIHIDTEQWNKEYISDSKVLPYERPVSFNL